RLVLLHGLESAMHLFNRHLLLDGINPPGVAEGIDERAVATAIELIPRRADHLQPRTHGALGEGIYVFDLERDADRRVSQCLRTEAATLGPLIRQHNG